MNIMLTVYEVWFHTSKPLFELCKDPHHLKIGHYPLILYTVLQKATPTSRKLWMNYYMVVTANNQTNNQVQTLYLLNALHTGHRKGCKSWTSMITSSLSRVSFTHHNLAVSWAKVGKSKGRSNRCQMVLREFYSPQYLVQAGWGLFANIIFWLYSIWTPAHKTWEMKKWITMWHRLNPI